MKAQTPRGSDVHEPLNLKTDAALQTEAELVRKAQNEPVWWIEKFLKAKLWSEEAKIVESVCKNRRTAVRSCHGASKSHVAAHVAL